ncbi:toprim domain-containing protein, partial [Sphingobium estronivorans]|uniref:toprim domain-containing protein n=1 Tax=Sphingobium estronivorans TaxID=1577690 RepID=UPI001F0731EB
RRQIVAVHRTFFALNAPRIADDLTDSRLMLGRPRQGAVMLAPATDMLGLAEGLETAISAMTLLDIPVWATLGSERLHRIALPSRVTRLILLPDNDQAGQRAVAKALVAYEYPGRIIQTIWPPMGMNDWNDVHRMEGSGGRNGWREGT